MSRSGKILLVSLPLALLLTAAFRFIQHTDREYSGWIVIYGESTILLEARCAELRTPAACATARGRKALVAEFRDYRDSVIAWRWPVLTAMLLAWVTAIVSCFCIARRFARRHIR